eukprot:scaffold3899_cov106-Isochrysis_galbana.AAC.6
MGDAGQALGLLWRCESCCGLGGKNIHQGILDFGADRHLDADSKIPTTAMYSGISINKHKEEEESSQAWRLAASGRGRGTSFIALTDDRRGPGVHMWGIVHQTIVSTVPTLNVFYSHTLKYGYHARASEKMVNTTLSYDRTAGLPCAPPTSQRGPQIARSIMRLESGGRDGISVASQPLHHDGFMYGEECAMASGLKLATRHSPQQSAASKVHIHMLRRQGQGAKEEELGGRGRCRRPQPLPWARPEPKSQHIAHIDLDLSFLNHQSQLTCSHTHTRASL